MCGICGIACRGSTFQGAAAETRITGMLAGLRHRGPDGSGSASTLRAALGATRLAIRGVEDGAQPVAGDDPGLLVVCNGEIDNHRELRRWLEARGRSVRGRSDVSVLPGLYHELGERFVERLDGVFALAVWDESRQKLLLARDRAGERSLFYRVTEDSILFATELASLAADTARPLHADRDALAGYLRYGMFAGPGTPLAEVRKVAPAEVVVFDEKGERRRRYWRWSLPHAPRRPPDTGAFDRIFREAVRRQSEVDVPFGVFLSGGLDSSLVAAVLRDLRPERARKAFTLRFREASYDEGNVAEEVASRLGLDLTCVWVEPDHFPEEIRTLVGLVGEPLGDPAWVPTALLARRAALEVKLALVGEGGDEVFGGYPTYLGAPAADLFCRLPRPLRASIAWLVRQMPPSERKVTLSFLLRRFVDGAELGGLERHRFWTSTIPPALLERLGVTPPSAAGPPPDGGALLDLLQRHDLEHLLAEGIMTKADRASMSCSLELRAPFLDRTVMEFAATLPVAERVRGWTTKVFLKRYALRYLPRAVVHRRKRGLSVPLSGWLRGPLHDWARDLLGSGLLEAAGVRSAAALALLDEHGTRRADHARALWTLLVLAEWLAWRERACGAGSSRTA